MTIGNWSTSQGLGLEYCIRDVNPDCAEMLKYCGCRAGQHHFTQKTEKRLGIQRIPCGHPRIH